MTARKARFLTWGSFGLSALLCAATVPFLVLAWDTPLRPTEFGSKGYAIAWSLVLSGVGAVLASRRPKNPIGWIFCGLGLMAGVLAFATEYARWALNVRGGVPPAGIYAAWLVEWIWIPLITGLAIVAAIFPAGRFLSDGWRRAMWAAVAISLVPTTLNAVIPRLTVYAGMDNPVGIGGDSVMEGAAASTTLMLPILAVGAGAIVQRFRRSRGEERLQLKWLTLSTTLVASMFGVYGVLVIVQGTPSPEGRGLVWLENLTILAFLAVPVSIAFGVLKYRLYDIDVVINRAVVYGGLAAFVTGIYVLVVIAVGSLAGYASNPVLSAIAAAIVALAFQPARRWAQHLANRFVYGRRATPYEVLSELSTRFADTYSLEDALPRLARVTAEAVGADRTRIWLRSDGLLRAAAAWPSSDAGKVVHTSAGEPTDELDGDRAFAVRHQGELLGAISVRMPPSEPLAAPQEKLLRDVSAHAGLVLRNVALVADLRASRQRIVSAQDERAHKLERNIHDGAQQQLVALAVKLRLTEQLIETDPQKARDAVAAVREDAADALETLRDLARGIYPPLLADQGLAVALESQARKSPLAVTVEADGIGRYPREIEATAYFCALEALQNVAKYANAANVSIRMSQRDGVLWFAVEDNGVGFDPQTARGSGLTNMRDRLEALGGELDVQSSPGVGTTVTGRISVTPQEGIS
jgi:signal transduction histidine kinase